MPPDFDSVGVALVLVVVGATMVLMTLRRGKPAASKCPEGQGLYPECLFIVAVSDSEITNRRPDGVVERLAVRLSRRRHRRAKDAAVASGASGL
jgi:hypothetical protein